MSAAAATACGLLDAAAAAAEQPASLLFFSLSLSSSPWRHPLLCSDELLREVTLDLPERGLLLLRIRDEIRMTLDAYKTLYEASVNFGVRKQLQAEQGIPELESKVAELAERKKVLESNVLALRNKVRGRGRPAGSWKSAPGESAAGVLTPPSLFLSLFLSLSPSLSLAAGPSGAQKL